MPQMSPLMWIFLYLYFLLLLMFINIVIYSFVVGLKKKLNKIVKNVYFNYNWLW